MDDEERKEQMVFVEKWYPLLVHQGTASCFRFQETHQRIHPARWLHLQSILHPQPNHSHTQQLLHFELSGKRRKRFMARGHQLPIQLHQATNERCKKHMKIIFQKILLTQINARNTNKQSNRKNRRNSKY